MNVNYEKPVVEIIDFDTKEEIANGSEAPETGGGAIGSQEGW